MGDGSSRDCEVAEETAVAWKISAQRCRSRSHSCACRQGGRIVGSGPSAARMLIAARHGTGCEAQVRQRRELQMRLRTAGVIRLVRHSLLHRPSQCCGRRGWHAPPLQRSQQTSRDHPVENSQAHYSKADRFQRDSL